MSKRILLVEDESSLHDLLKLNLEMDGHKVIGVKDGTSAVSTAGATNTGSGGGAGNGNSSPYLIGSAGGSGIVIIRYLA